MSGVKRVTVDFDAKIDKLCPAAHTESLVEWADRAVHAENMLGLEEEVMKSSAY